MRGGASHRDIATAMVGWVRMLTSADWATIKARSLLTDDMLNEANRLSLEILSGTGTNALDPIMVAAVTDVRKRMFTVLVLRYDEVRRGATFMRWHEGDVDAFVPSLHAKGPRQSDEAKQPSARNPAGPAIVAGDGVPPAVEPQPEEVRRANSVALTG
jgi:hypothetical protein